MTVRKPEANPIDLCASSQIAAPTDRNAGIPAIPIKTMAVDNGEVTHKAMPIITAENDSPAQTNESVETSGKTASVKKERKAALTGFVAGGVLLLSTSLFVIAQLLAAVIFVGTFVLFEAATETTFVGAAIVAPAAIAAISLTCKNMRRYLHGLDGGDA